MTSVEIRVGDRAVVAEVELGGLVRIDGVSLRVDVVSRGLYRVNHDQRQWLVAVAGPPDNRWIFVDGQVAQVQLLRGPADERPSVTPRTARAAGGAQDLASPMPATVIKVLVEPGARVSRGETLVMLEAMKMEVPIRAPRDGVVRAIHCKVGDLVQADVILLDLVGCSGEK